MSDSARTMVGSVWLEQLLEENTRLKAGIAKYIDTIEKGGCDTEPVECIVEELELLLKEESQ
jgi:hypothetical protein